MSKTKQKDLNIITIPYEKLDPYIRCFWGSAEKIFVGTDVTEVKSGGSKVTRALFITTAALYIYKYKSFTGVELSHQYTVIDLTKVSYIEPDTLVLAFDKKEIVFRTEGRPDDALKIGTLLLMQHACNFYNVPNATRLRVESSPAGALTYVRCPVRPKNALQTRLTSLSHYYKKPFPQSSINQYSQWDNTHTGTLTIDDKFDSKNAAEAIAHAIAWDCDIKTLVLKNFAPGQIGKVLEKIFEESFSIQRIHFDGYTNEQIEPINLKSREETSISSISFKDCNPTLVINVIRGLGMFSGRLRSLQLSNVNFKQKDWNELFSAIKRLPCFMKFYSLIIENLNLKEFPTNLLCLIISKSRSFSCVTINKCESDLSGFVSQIFNEAKSIKHLEMIRCKFIGPLKAKTAPNMTYICMSYSKISPQFFKSFANISMTRASAIPFVLDMSSIQGSNYKELFASIKDIQLSPVICEFLFNGNILGKDSTNELFNFLKTQKESLKFLSLINCIVNVTNIALPALLSLINNSNIGGFDITSDKDGKGKDDYINFLKGLTEVNSLKSITIGNVNIGDEGTKILLDVVKKNSFIEELSVDGIGISSQKKFCSFFDEILKIESIKYLGYPKKEIAKLGITKDNLTKDVKETLLCLKKKKGPISQLQRLALYEKIEYDESTGNFADGEVRREKQNPLDELEAIQISMCRAICEIEPCAISPEETARLIMNNITTSSSSISKEVAGSHKRIGSIFAKQ